MRFRNLLTYPSVGATRTGRDTVGVHVDGIVCHL